MIAAIAGGTVLVVLLVNVVIPSFTGGPSAVPQHGPTGTISTGKSQNIESQNIPPSGGAITVEKPGDPLHGMGIVVPPNSYPDNRSFTISSAPVRGHTFGDNFNPISPMITVENGGEYSEELMLVTIPVIIPDDSFAMAFLFDEATGKLEGIPLVDEGNDSITVATRHFSNMVVSAINKYVLLGDIDSGFRPGVDDWQFTNYGSYISPGGHCWGQSMTAMWYYCEKTLKDKPHLWGLYDNNGGVATPDLWQDDSLGYRLSSTVQQDAVVDNLLHEIGEFIYQNDERTYNAFAYSILMTGEPQYIRIRQTTGSSVHAMVVYRVANNTLYIADPNYPGRTDREIKFTDGNFQPYNSGDNAEAISHGQGKVYDKIDYLAKTTYIKWDRIGQRWTEFESGTVGNDRFPSYNIKIEQDDGSTVAYTEGFRTNSESIWVIPESTVAGTDLNCWVWENGVRLTPDADNGYELSTGRNQWGLEIVAETANRGWKYVDFAYIDIYTSELYIEPSALKGEPGETYTFTAHSDNLPENPRFEWDFGDGTAGQTTATSNVSHQFTEAGRYTISLALYDDTDELVDQATAYANIMTESTDLVGLLQSFNEISVRFNGTDIHRTWSKASGEGTDTSTWGVGIPWAVAGKNSMDITWRGPSFSGTLAMGDIDRSGSIHEVNGKVSADGTVVESIVFSYRYRNEGANTVTDAYATLEFTDIPLTWNPGREDGQAELIYRAYDADVARSHVVLIEHHTETHRNNELESSRTYASTDWSEDARFSFTLKKY